MGIFSALKEAQQNRFAKKVGLDLLQDITPESNHLTDYAKSIITGENVQALQKRLNAGYAFSSTLAGQAPPSPEKILQISRAKQFFNALQQRANARTPELKTPVDGSLGIDEKIFNAGRAPDGYTTAHPKFIKPSILAHQIGHGATTNWGNSQKKLKRLGISSLLATSIPVAFKIRDNENGAQFTKKDAIINALAGIFNGVHAYSFGTQNIKDQLKASGFGMRLLKGFRNPKSPQLAKPLLTPKGLRASKVQLRKTLGTYKKTRILQTLLAAVTPSLGTGSVIGYRKLMQSIRKRREEKELQPKNWLQRLFT